MNWSHHPTALRAHLLSGVLTTITLAGAQAFASGQAFWGDYAGNPQHTALSTVASQDLDQILWSTPVDLDPTYNGGILYIHYGSPVFTQADTVIVPLKTTQNGGFEVEALNGLTGSLKWTETTNYTPPSASWFPAYGPAMTPSGTLYYAGAGGTLYSISNLDFAAPTTPKLTAFFGNATYNANQNGFNSSVEVCTPLTTAANGDVYFGYRVSGAAPNGMMSGIAMIAPNGAATYVSASQATGGQATQIPIGCAPALSANGQTVYVGMSNSGQGAYLVSLNATTLTTQGIVECLDPRNGNQALALDISSASPMVAPDGSVYYGVFENPYYSSKGWMMHYSANLQTTYTPGLFGWDDTASIVPKSMVPSYTGSASYLIMTKYNDYLSTGGSGLNKVAILDPTSTMVDPRTGVTVMKVVEAVTSPTLDPGEGTTEWCINSAVVDPFTDSVLVNNEDGDLFRWNLGTNVLTQEISLAPPTGEAYTPTIIGPNGQVYAINDATLFAVGDFVPGSTPEPGSVALLLAGLSAGAIAYRRRFRRSRAAHI